MAPDIPPCTFSTTIRMRNTPDSAIAGQLIPTRVSAARRHIAWPRASAQRGCGCAGGCGGCSNDGGGGCDCGGCGRGGCAVGSCAVGASVSGGRSFLWTGFPQFEQNLASGSNLFPQ